MAVEGIYVACINSFTGSINLNSRDISVVLPNPAGLDIGATISLSAIVAGMNLDRREPGGATARIKAYFSVAAATPMWTELPVSPATNNLFAKRVLMVTFRLTTWLADAWAIGTVYTFGEPLPMYAKMRHEKVVAAYDRASGAVLYDHRVMATRRDRLPSDRTLVASAVREAVACGASRAAVATVVLGGRHLPRGAYRIDLRRRRPVRVTQRDGSVARTC
jgi:hypothetical protein